MKIRDTIARNLRRARKARKLTQEQLSFLAEVDRTYVGSLERKKYNPTVEMLDRLATALGIAVVDLFEAEPDT